MLNNKSSSNNLLGISIVAFNTARKLFKPGLISIQLSRSFQGSEVASRLKTGGVDHCSEFQRLH